MRRLITAVTGVVSVVICGAAAVLGAPTASATASAVVESSSDWGLAGGSYRYLAGSVRNTGDTSLAYIKVRLNLYDAANVLVGTDYTYVNEDVLAPGTLGGYQTTTSLPPGFDHATATVESLQSTTRLASRDFGVSLSNTYSDGYYTHYVGTITNVGTRSLDWVSVQMMFRDASGRVVGVEDTYAGFGTSRTLNPGEAAPFELTRDNDFPAASSYSIYGDSSYAPATSVATSTPTPTASPRASTPVLVQPVVTAGLTSSRAPVGTRVSLRGTVTPSSGGQVTLRRKVGTGWSTVSTHALSSDAFSFSLPTSTSRVDSYAVSVSGPGLVSTTSKTLSLAVYRAALTSVSPRGSEYVVIKNTGVVTLPLARWRLKDASGKSVVLPRRVVAPGAALRVYTGRGHSTSRRLYLATSKDLWSPHDTVTLLNAAGVKVAGKRY